MKFNRIAIVSMMALSMTACSGQNSKTEKSVHDYIMNHPEVLVQSLQNMQQKQFEQARESIQKTTQVAPKFIDQLFHQTSDPTTGPGGVTVVEFFDYQCSHCIEMTPIMDSILKSNSNVRIVYKEFPIRGPVSETAAKAALAAQMQGKYVQFHQALMSLKQLPLTDDLIFKTAETVGLNVQKLKSDMSSDAVTNQIKTNTQLAQSLGLIGTPAFFIAKSDIKSDANPNSIVFVPGGIDKNQMTQVIRKVSQ